MMILFGSFYYLSCVVYFLHYDMYFLIFLFVYISVGHALREWRVMFATNNLIILPSIGFNGD